MADTRGLDDIGDIDDMLDPPPPYKPTSNSTCQFTSLPEMISTSDGRVDVHVGSRFSRNLERLMSNQPSEQIQQNGTVPPTPPRPPKWDIKLNIVIQVVGSRGDVQPFIALGNELQKSGHRIRLATHAVFEQFVTNAGLKFYPIGGDPVELMSYMVRNPGLIPGMKSLRTGDIQRKRAAIAEILDGCWQSCIEPDPHSGTSFVADAIIANPPSFGHVHCAQALGVPVHLMFTMPWSSTRAFPHPLTNLRYSGDDPSLGNLASYHFVEWMTWQGLGDLVNQWRKDVLELERISTSEGPNLVETLNVPFTYCWSPALIPKPLDWGSNIGKASLGRGNYNNSNEMLDVCGFFFRDPPDYEPPPDLAAFLRAGPPPIYIGFGSIVLEDADKMLSILLDAVQQAGVRAIISCGWGNLQGQTLPSVHYVGDCPHEWLFQHVAAVVHHGGAGTTACGLLNGKPTTIVPFFGDQPFWGNMVAAAGAGPKLIPHKDLTASKLADAITYSLSPHVAIQARSIAEKIKRESGVRAAVDSFHAHLPRQKMQCALVPGHPAVWEFRKGKQTVSLSKAAAGILAHRGRLQAKHLKRHETKPITIETRRWDPLTAILSASFSTVSGMAHATAGIILDPYKEYRRHRAQSQSQDNPSLQSPPDTNTTNTEAHTKKVALVAASSIGKLLGRPSRGALIDLPLAAVEGMRAVPRIYGDELTAHDKVTDWKSGGVAAWSTFSHGLYEGVTDIFVHTYHGKKDQGAVGVAKGLTKGFVGFTAKTGAATVGLIAYPNQGIYRSLQTAVRTGPAKRIEQARWAEVGYLMARMGEGLSIDPEGVCEVFDAIMVSRNRRS